LNNCNLPPTEIDCPIPTPPEAIIEPVVEDVEFVVDVDAKPETLKMSVDGL
jgi:hypothetical protein